jgi:hypothetical protein
MASKARVKLVNVGMETAAFNSKIGIFIDFQVHAKQIYILQGMPSWNSTPSLHVYRMGITSSLPTSNNP